MSHNATTSARFKRFCETNNLPHLLGEPNTIRPETTSSAVSRTGTGASSTAPSTTSADDYPHIPQLALMANGHESGNKVQSTDTIRCCCGRSSCVYLQHNNASLAGLERDLDTAARLGQALLSRHESYIQSSRLEHERLQSQATSLECEKTHLQNVNEVIIAENRNLLDQLEALNSRLGDSDAVVKNLEATLSTAQYEVRRLNAMAARAEALERQLAELEVDHLQLSDQLIAKVENERTVLNRWREAEDRVHELTAEVERIESEARRDKETHEELMSRVERGHQQEISIGRLTGATTAIPLQAPDRGGAKNEVVSHFVRDILQDNANLQAGIVELRELLQASNEEVQGLREQIFMHQPFRNETSNGEIVVSPSNLLQEVEWLHQQQQQPVSQEVHVHHHYHARLPGGRRDKVSVGPRRHRRKRSPFGLLSSTPESSVPPTPSIGPLRHVSSPLPPVVNTVQMSPRRHRWSVQSSATTSSIPSSPKSYFDRMSSGSIFDRIEHATESSRPTSPESVVGDLASPRLTSQKRNPPDYAMMACEETTEVDENNLVSQAMDHADTVSVSGAEPPDSNHMRSADEVPQEAVHELADKPKPPELSTSSKNAVLYKANKDAGVGAVLPLRRSTSTDSLVSISGMDIHLAKRKASQVFVISRNTALVAPRPHRTISAALPLASVADVTASSSRRSLSGGGNATSLSRVLLSGLAGTSSSDSPQTATIPSPAQPSGLGSLVGGWVRGRWGIAPMKSTGDLKAPAASNALSRSVGINTKGSVPGLRPPVRTPSEIHAKVLNKGLLKESLEE